LLSSATVAFFRLRQRLRYLAAAMLSARLLEDSRPGEVDQKRQRLPDECSFGFSQDLLVAAESRNRIWKALFNRVPLVENGQYVTNVQWTYNETLKWSLDNTLANSCWGVWQEFKNFRNSLLEDEDIPEDEHQKFIEIQTLSSWLEDLCSCSARACLLVLSKYSSLLFIASFAKSGSWWQFFILIVLWLGSVAAPMYTARLTMKSRYKSLCDHTGDIVENGVRPYARDNIENALWFLTLVGVPHHILQAPIFFSPISSVGKKAFLKYGGARTCWTEYRSQSERHVLENEGKHVHMIVCFWCDVFMMFAKLCISWYTGSITIPFFIGSVVIPGLIDLATLLDWATLRKARRIFKSQLTKAAKSSDVTIRHSAKESLKRHFGVNEESNPAELLKKEIDKYAGAVAIFKQYDKGNKLRDLWEEGHNDGFKYWESKGVATDEAPEAKEAKMKFLAKVAAEANKV